MKNTLAAVLFLYSLGLPAYGQTSAAEFVDRIHSRVKTAADAAGLILEADAYRREAERLSAAGHVHEACARLRLADEIITGAVSNDESLGSDPLLQDYLRQLRSAAVAAEISKPTHESASPESLKHINDDYPFIREVLAKHNLPAALAAVVVIESAGNASALSPKGALGLWQLMPDTARRYGLRVNRVVDDRLDPVKSTYAAARYLRDLYQIFNDWPLTLAAYNAGENRIQRLIQKAGIQGFAELASRQMLPAETVHYVPAVLALMQLNRHPLRN